jgi:hypothetical protein
MKEDMKAIGQNNGHPDGDVNPKSRGAPWDNQLEDNSQNDGEIFANGRRKD